MRGLAVPWALGKPAGREVESLWLRVERRTELGVPLSTATLSSPCHGDSLPRCIAVLFREQANGQFARAVRAEDENAFDISGAARPADKGNETRIAVRIFAARCSKAALRSGTSWLQRAMTMCSGGSTLSARPPELRRGDANRAGLRDETLALGHSGVALLQRIFLIAAAHRDGFQRGREGTDQRLDQFAGVIGDALPMVVPGSLEKVRGRSGGVVAFNELGAKQSTLPLEKRALLFIARPDARQPLAKIAPSPRRGARPVRHLRDDGARARPALRQCAP